MAELDKTQPNQFEQRGTNPFNNPTPGESLTKDPEQKFPWEQAPQINDAEAAIKEIFITLTEKEKIQVSITGISGQIKAIKKLIEYEKYPPAIDKLNKEIDQLKNKQKFLNDDLLLLKNK